MLWGREDGDDAHDMGHAALQSQDGVQCVKPADVESVGPVI